ncbi:MAG TPA: hypothetical protein VES73_02615 [Lamprocystis sp. (in: g-proteobacteria)]|nr:hypothetical protein [Lamprocystis sp. (in: g-proteobacteria)]
MLRTHRYTPTVTAAVLAAVLNVTWDNALAASPPTLWGYGVKSCSDFLTTAPGAGVAAALAGDEYLRYREWLAGLVTGINLTTASDVLRGAELDAAMGRIRTRCQTHPREDFFNAAMTLIRSLRADKKTGTAGEAR